MHKFFSGKLNRLAPIVVLHKNTIQENFKLFLLSTLIIILSFPEYSFFFGKGIDPSLAWLFNFLFENDLKLGREIVFPHGPLAFLMYPIYSNALEGIMVKIILQYVFLYNLYIVVGVYGKFKWLIFFISAFFLFKFYSISLLVLFIVFTSYLNYFNTTKLQFKVTGILIACFAFYIKANLAIIAGLISLSFLVLEYFIYKEWKKTILSVAIGVFFLLFFWFLMYHTLEGFLHFILGMINLSQDNSAAAAVYPNNNWVFLSLFLLIIVILPFIQKEKKAIYFAILFLPGIFGAWKHGIAREDIYHMVGFFSFSISALLIFILYVEKNFYRNLVLIVVALSFLYLNLENVISYNPIKREVSGVINFKNAITGFNKIVEKSIDEANKDIASRKLPQSILDSIGNKTIDVYPWDYSIIAANNLNLKPRIVIQSYAAYTSWLDKQNAEHYKSADAPEFLIWHSEENSPSLAGLKSIDGRYLLNDEPQTLLELFKYYELRTKTDLVLLFKRRQEPLELKCNSIKNDIAVWNKWLPVPNFTEDLLRAKLTIKGNLKRKIKSFFYKDEAFYVYYKLENGDIISKRIVPKNAADGLWVNPFIQFPGDSCTEYNVKEIMLKCSNPGLMKPTIKISWESVSFGAFNKNTIYKFFGKPEVTSKPDSVIFESVNTFDTENIYWDPKPEQISNSFSYEGQNSCTLKPGEFSSGIKISLDSLPKSLLKISATSFILSEYYDKATMVLSLENNNGAILWQGANTFDYIIDRNAWNYMENKTVYLNNTAEPVLLKVYFWNTGKNKLYIDNINVQIRKTENSFY